MHFKLKTIILVSMVYTNYCQGIRVKKGESSTDVNWIIIVSTSNVIYKHRWHEWSRYVE